MWNPIRERIRKSYVAGYKRGREECQEIDGTRINRVEVIDEDGRSYVNYDAYDVQVSVQDHGRTLKIFIGQ